MNTIQQRIYDLLIMKDYDEDEAIAIMTGLLSKYGDDYDLIFKEIEEVM